LTNSTPSFRSRELILSEAIEYATTVNPGEGYYIDIETVEKVISFVSILKHTQGSLAGVQFQLLPFQIKFLIDVLATKSVATGRRRYTTALLMLPRKNGKTELIAAVLNYFLFADPELGKEIYCAANETEQARIIFKATETMVKQAPALMKRSSIWKSTKTIERNGAFDDFVKVLTSNADTKDGLKPYVVVYDELHAAKSSELYTVLEEGMAHRDEPLFIVISTAGYNHEGIMKRKYDYAKKVRDGVIDDPSFYSMIFEPDEDDDWTDESVWRKVNPAMGYGVKIEYLRNKFVKAQHSGEEEVAFKTKHLNIWTSSAKAWIKTEDWARSYSHDIHEEDLRGETCFAGLDLSSTTDITAFVMVFRKDDARYDILCRFWIPEDSIKERSRRDKVPYEDWEMIGLVFKTPGNIIDYDYIEEQIKADCEKFDVKEIAYDAWNATSMVTRLDDAGVSTMVPFRQGFKSMSAPTKMIETLVLQKKLNHGGNKVLTWMMSNVAIKRDPTDAIKIDKAKSSEKVDGMVALAMALGREMVHGSDSAESIYETRGVRGV